jgi:cell shape-determining protein MreC
VESVSRGNNLFLEVRVTPSADFARLTDVLLLSPSPAAKESSEVSPGAAR